MPERSKKISDFQPKTFIPDQHPPLYRVLLQGPAGPMLLKFWLKTRKSILNKVRKIKIPTPIRFGTKIEKIAGGAESAPARNRIKGEVLHARVH